MDLHLSGCRALITGASKGIGYAAASVLGAEGCGLVLVSRDRDALSAAADRLRAGGVRGAIEIIPADLSTAAGIAAVADAVDRLDVLVNNAGAIPAGDLLKLSVDDWKTAWDLKVFGYLGLTRALWPKLSRPGGAVVNVIGAAGERFEPGYLAGSAGNAALMAMTRALGKDAPREGLRVVGINPGPVATERLERLQRAHAEREGRDPGRWRDGFHATAFGRPAEPDEIANAIAFLASPRASYISGTILTIDDSSR